MNELALKPGAYAQIRVREPAGERTFGGSLTIGGEGADIVVPGTAAGPALRLEWRDRQWVVESEAGRRQLCRIDFNLPLANFTAENLYLRHAGNRQDLRLDDPLHYVAQFYGRKPIAGVAEVHEVLHRGAQESSRA